MFTGLWTRIGGILAAVAGVAAAVMAIRQQGKNDARQEQEIETGKAADRIRVAEDRSPVDRSRRNERLRDGSA